jgi:ABC-2 type transport system permease protein
MWKKTKDIIQEIAGFYLDEMKLALTDAGTLLFFVIAIFIYSWLYSMGYEKETVRDLPVAVVDLDQTSTSRQYSRMADATEQIHVSCKPGSLKEAEQLFFEGRINGVILIPNGFEKDILSARRTTITVYCDVSYFMLYKQVYAGAVYSSGTFGAGVEVKRFLSQGKTMKQALDMQDPVKVSTYMLYNPSGGYGSFVMPPMILLIMQQLLLIGIGMLGGTIREKNQFLKMNGSVIYRWGTIRLVFAKASAYVTLFAVTALFPMGIIHRAFMFPDHGHVLSLLVLMIPYLYSVAFMGLAISMLFKERIQSMLFMVFISPIIVFMSDISWPVSSLPVVLQYLVKIFPCAHAIPAYLRLRTMGVGLHSVHTEITWIIAQMFVYFALACFAYKFSVRRFGKRIGTVENDK